jgi:hypothetical protein
MEHKVRFTQGNRMLQYNIMLILILQVNISEDGRRVISLNVQYEPVLNRPVPPIQCKFTAQLRRYKSFTVTDL